MSTGEDEESSRAGVSALSSILQSKLLVPPPGSFPKGQGDGDGGGVLVKRRKGMINAVVYPRCHYKTWLCFESRALLTQISEY